MEVFLGGLVIWGAILFGGNYLLTLPARREFDRRRLQVDWDERCFHRLLLKLNGQISSNIDLFISSYRSTVKVSSLGVRNYRVFFKDAREFLLLHVDMAEVDLLTRKGITFQEFFSIYMAESLIEAVEQYVERADSKFPLDAKSGREYEAMVARVLRIAGWDAEVTKASGDHGVDIIAFKDGQRAAIQCKYYAKPVGNAAVQEVVSGRTHYSAHIGLVVAPNGFTSAARALAVSNGVELCHHTEIAQVLEKFS